ELRLVFVKATLAAVGVEVGRIKSLNVLYADLNDASIRLTALALQSPDSELRELKLEYTNDTTSSIETRLVPASKHPNCNLAKLSLSTYGGAKVAEHFHKRLALFVLLQGRQGEETILPVDSEFHFCCCLSKRDFFYNPPPHIQWNAIRHFATNVFSRLCLREDDERWVVVEALTCQDTPTAVLFPGRIGFLRTEKWKACSPPNRLRMKMERSFSVLARQGLCWSKMCKANLCLIGCFAEENPGIAFGISSL
ncbi:hypothetical protein BASA62_002773, partial [Batrachochytrium salamandrivorans]